MMVFWLEVLLIFILMVISGFFSASEIAVIAVRRSRITQLKKEKGIKGLKAKYVAKLHSDPDKFFAIVQVGMTVTASAASALGGAIAVKLLKPIVAHLPIGGSEAAAESISLTIVIVIISYLFLVVAELYPKALAIRFTEKIALFAGTWTYYLMKFSLPLISLLTTSTNLCLKFSGVKIDRKEDASVTEEEVKHLLAEGLWTGTFNKTERELIHGVFDFADTVARQVMTPRTNIEGIPIDMSPDEILNFVTGSRYSRYPVFDGSLDNIVGIIHARDVIGILREKNLVILQDILRTPYFIPDSKPIPGLLRDFQQNQVHLAIVLDEFGGTAGLVTLEDIIEEIVGEIQDEYDKEPAEWSRASDGSLSVAANMSVDDFNELFNAELPAEDADTIAGLIVNHLGRLPKSDEITEIAGFRFVVTARDGNRLQRLRLSKVEPEKQN